MRKIIKSDLTQTKYKSLNYLRGYASESVFYKHANQSFAWSQHGGNQVRISDIANFTLHTLKTWIRGWKSFNNHLISCKNYLSPWKCTTTPE